MSDLRLSGTERAIDSLSDFDLFRMVSLPLLDEDWDRDPSALGELTPGQRAILGAWILEAEVPNGGFAQFFSNSSGAFAPAILEGLERLGALQHRDLLKKACALFPDGTPPRSRELRNEIFDDDPDLLQVLWDRLSASYYASPSLGSICARHIRSHLAEFFRGRDFLIE